MSISALPCGCLNSCLIRCAICKQHAVDGIEFEGGNNAELSMTMRLCEAHFAEYEKDEYAFQIKYAEKIDTGCYERLIDHADMMRDDL